MISLSLVLWYIRADMHLSERKRMKEGDKLLAKFRESQPEGISMSYPTEKSHILHQEHRIKIENGDEYQCNACQKPGEPGLQYSCKDCNFNLHLTCATSEELWNLWTSLNPTNFTSISHPHPMSLVAESSKFVCSHCHDEGFSLNRYKCDSPECKSQTQIHFICANNPSGVFSFLHLDHLLELKTRHYFKKCAVCHRGGEKNARVYTCETCEFFVHPECAQRRQFVKHPLHSEEGHVLVYREIGENHRPVCQDCKKECEYWSYSCYVCEEFHVHRDCLIKFYCPDLPVLDRKSKIKKVGEEVAKEGAIHLGLVIGKVAFGAVTGIPL